MPRLDAQVAVRVPKELKLRLEQQARREMLSVSAMIVKVMEAYLEQAEQSPPPPRKRR